MRTKQPLVWQFAQFFWFCWFLCNTSVGHGVGGDGVGICGTGHRRGHGSPLPAMVRGWCRRCMRGRCRLGVLGAAHGRRGRRRVLCGGSPPSDRWPHRVGKRMKDMLDFICFLISFLFSFISPLPFPPSTSFISSFFVAGVWRRGIATGKSSVVRVAVEQVPGLAVVDADAIARRVVEPGMPAYAHIVAAFGPEVVEAEAPHRLDRRRVREAAFADARKRAALNRATHMAIFREMLASIVLARLGGRTVLLDAPLLYETGLHRLCRWVMVVDCQPETQRARIMARDHVSAAQAEAVMAAQLPSARRLALADDVIDNSGPLGDLADRVKKCLDVAGLLA
jgi:dephospho-CoA kinase